MLQIDLPGGMKSFDPGSEIELIVKWELLNAPSSVEVRLVWSTSGKGDQDLKVVQRIILEDTQPREERSVLLTLPWGPYTFSGKLISLIWGIEAVAFPSKVSTRHTVTIAPKGEEVLLRSVDK